MKTIIKKFSSETILVISVAIWFLILYWRLPSSIWEDGFVTPWFIGNHLIPYKDFSMGQYFPFSKIMMLPINELFNWNVRSTIWASLMLVGGVILLLSKISDEILGKGKKILPILYFSLWYGYILKQNTFEINLFLIFLFLVAFYLYLIWLKRQKSILIFLIGFILSLSVLSQQIMIVPTTILLLFILIPKMKKDLNIKEHFERALIFLGGFVIAPILTFLWLYKIGVTKEFVHATITYYLKGEYPFNQYFSPNDILMLFILNVPFILAIFQSFSERFKIDKLKLYPLLITNLFFVFVSLAAVLHPRRFLLFLPLGSLFFGINFLSEKPSLKISTKTIFLLTLVPYLLLSIIPWYTTNLAKTKRYEIYNLHHPGDNVYEAIQWIKQNTKPDEKIFSFETMIIYFEAERLPSINRTYILPWAFEPFDEFYQLWQKNPPKYALVSELMFERFNGLGYKDRISKLRDILNNDYYKKVSFDWMSVYVKKDF